MLKSAIEDILNLDNNLTQKGIQSKLKDINITASQYNIKLLPKKCIIQEKD